MINSVFLTFKESLFPFNHGKRFLRSWFIFLLLVQMIHEEARYLYYLQYHKLSNSSWICLDHLYIIEKRGVEEQNPVGHLFELTEYLRYKN